MSTTCVVMLDIDDVLCLNTKYGGFDAAIAVNGRHPNPGDVYLQLFASRARRALAEVHGQMGGGIRYVVSSTWRESFDRHQMSSIFMQSGLEFVANNLYEGERWRTPVHDGWGKRVDEIASWLDRHWQGEPFVILDDRHSGASLLPALEVTTHPFAGRIVLCEEDVGLTDDHVGGIVAALRRPVALPGGAAL